MHHTWNFRFHPLEHGLHMRGESSMLIDLQHANAAAAENKHCKQASGLFFQQLQRLRQPLNMGRQAAEN